MSQHLDNSAHQQIKQPVALSYSGVAPATERDAWATPGDSRATPRRQQATPTVAPANRFGDTTHAATQQHIAHTAPNAPIRTAEEKTMIHDRYLQAKDCADLTGIPAGTWRYWAHIGSGPRSFKLGHRRVWRESAILAWIAEQEQATATGGAA
ncbi:helix-turn-helix transcriptional regulator [Nocardia sp. NPDC055002]